MPDESSSTSALVTVNTDSEDVTDLAFPHLRHSSALPEWITKKITTPHIVKHRIGASNSEILDAEGRPAWLNQAQKEMFDQVC